MAFGLYLHIPYCLAKCRYCDFYSKGGSRGVPQEYVDALVRRMDDFRRQGLLPEHPDTVYFGGGTPSLLTPEQAARLISAASPAPGAEVTLEANPETVDETSLSGFLQAGVNRLSLGVQTAFDESLARLGRPHTAAQSREAFAAARRAGFSNISGDIMLALPQYTREEFDATLELIGSGGATHISAYLLKIEPGTAFGKRPPAGLPDEDAAADFYLYGVEQLEKAGFAQYEISNFARSGFDIIYQHTEQPCALRAAVAHNELECDFLCPLDLRIPQIVQTIVPKAPNAGNYCVFILKSVKLLAGDKPVIALGKVSGSGTPEEFGKFFVYVVCYNAPVFAAKHCGV